MRCPLELGALQTCTHPSVPRSPLVAQENATPGSGPSQAELRGMGHRGLGVREKESRLRKNASPRTATPLGPGHAPRASGSPASHPVTRTRTSDLALRPCLTAGKAVDSIYSGLWIASLIPPAPKPPPKEGTLFKHAGFL